MACCMLGLLLVYQCIDAWARIRTGVLRGHGALRGSLGRLVSPVGLQRRLVLVAALAFSAGLVSAATVAHAGHLAGDVHSMGATATDWCRTLLPTRGGANS